MVGNATWMALLITVQSGSRGDAVRTARRQLNQSGAGLRVDGVFGPATAQAVRWFQQRHRLTVDAIVGVGTWFALVSAG